MLQGFFNSGRRVGVLITALFFLCTTALMGQMFLGSVVGQVTDTSGAVVPGAKVVLTNTQTLVQRETVATGAGDYTFDNVPTGTYKVAVKMDGFEEAVSTEIIVGTGATVRFDATLTTGKVTQRVEVTAQAPTLNTENAEIGSVVTRTEIADLPMSKSPMDFRYLDSSNQQGGYLSGQRSNSGFYSVDGVSAMAPAWGAWSGPQLSMSMDSIQDITEVSATPSAEYGDVAHVEISTRSGTNAFHGAAYWDTDNYALDASDYFTHTKGNGAYYQYFGGTIGGPLIIPHLYNGKNRTFFFAQMEDFMQPGGYVSQGSVPTAAMRNGDFSSLLTLPTPIIIYDPTTYNVATNSFSPFPGNIITNGSNGPNKINSVAAKIAGTTYTPLPNFTNPTGVFYENNYLARLPNAHPDYYPTVRVDHNFRGGKDAITGRWQYRRQNEDGNANGLGAEYANTQNRDTTNAYISETHSFSPRLVNEARIGFSRDESVYYSNTMGTPIAQDWGLDIPNISGLSGMHGFPGVDFQNFTNLVGQANTGWAQNTHEYADNVTYSRGKHTLKMGFSDRRYLVDEVINEANNFFGYTSYGAFATQSQTPYGTNNPTGGFDYASFLLGIPSSSGIDLPGPNGIVRYGTYAAYLQDDWRVSSRLTVNAGLRWEHTPAPVDQNDMRYSFNPANGDIVVPSAMGLSHVSPLWPSTYPIETAAQAGWSTGRSLLSTDQTFGPRLGLAYRLPYQVVVRAGAGLFYSPLLDWGVIGPYQGGPFAWAQSFTNIIATSGQTSFALPNPFSGVNGTGACGTVCQNGGFNISTNKNYLRTPLTQQYNIALEKQFGASTIATIDYRGHHLIETIYNPDLNQPTPNTGANLYEQLNYQQYWQVQYGVNGGSEFGNLVDLRLERRYGKGLTFNLGYTHTLLTEDVRSYGATYPGDSDIFGNPSYSWNRKLDLGPDGGLVRNRFVGSGLWDLPFGKGQRFGASIPKALQQVVGGWRTSYVLTMRSGYFNDVACSGCVDSSNTRVGSRLDVNEIGKSALSHATANMWFNANAYAPDTVPGTFGDVSPGSIVGPGLVNLDFGLSKTFPIHESLKLKFQMTSMNALNHPNLGNPNTDISSPQVGAITSLTNYGGMGSSSNNSGMRQVRLGLRLEF
ncbi:MAG: carboxypeptidase regulatory-like domain-containing protein [Terriglobia bacterium]|jgi:hypothetical protein